MLYQPWLIWVALAAALPFGASIKVGPISLVDLALVGAVWLWLADGARRHTLRLHFSWPTLALTVYTGVLLMLMLRAASVSEAATEVLKWTEVLVALLLVRNMCTPAQVRWIVVGLLLGGVAQALLGLYQFIFQIGPPWFVIFGRFMRASGSFRQPNPYAGYLGLCLPVAFSLTLWAWQRMRQRPLLLLGYGGATAAIGIGLLVSWSRGGWLGAVGGVGIVLALYNWQTRLLSAFAAILALLTTLLGTLRPEMVPASLLQRLQDIPTLLGLRNLEEILQQPLTDENFALLERVAHWVVALRLWERTPWLGIGPGNYAWLYPEIIQLDPYLVRWTEPLGHAHNIYLNVLAEGGLVGLAAFLLLWGIIGAWVLWLYRSAPAESWNRALILGVLGVLVHLSIHNFFDNLFVHSMYLHIGLWLCVLSLLDWHAVSPSGTKTVQEQL